MTAVNRVHEPVCVDCRTRIRDDQDRDYGPPSWVHVDGVKDHDAAPAPRCYSCGSFNWTATDEAWGVAFDCGDCGHHHFMSIGD